MKYSLVYPLGNQGMGSSGSAAFTSAGDVVRVVQAAERAGFSSVAMTDHPAPSRKWLDGGGHMGFDPLTALAFCAAATSSIRLMTYLLVLPYRNPLVAARSIATVDRLSGGRLDLVVGPGYLRSEFSALGVEFEERGELFDEALTVLKSVFSDESYVFEGKNFTARGVAIAPGPVQMPHPPLWIGGNGVRARNRAATIGNGWSPIQVSEEVVATTRSVGMTTLDDIRTSVEDLHKRVVDAGREPGAVKVQLQSHTVATIAELNRSVLLEKVLEIESIGVDQLVLNAPDGSVEEAIAAIESFGSDIISAH